MERKAVKIMLIQYRALLICKLSILYHWINLIDTPPNIMLPVKKVRHLIIFRSGLIESKFCK